MENLEWLACHDHNFKLAFVTIKGIQLIQTCMGGKNLAPLQMDTKDPNDVTEVPPIIGKSPQWQGFIFGPDGMTVLIPEPSTVGIAVLGLSALLLRVTPISRSPRRRSQGT